MKDSCYKNYLFYSIILSVAFPALVGHKNKVIIIYPLITSQKLCLKSLLINVDNKHNKFFSLFSFFNKKFKPGNCLIDLFSNCFSFHSYSPNVKEYIGKLDDKVFRASSNSFLVIVTSNASIKNHITTLISHIHSFNKPIIKTRHRAVNITTTEAKLFAIWMWYKSSN